MKNIYKRAAKIYSCHNYYGRYTSHCLFFKGRVVRSWFEDEHGYTDNDWTHHGYESDPWKGNTWRNLYSSGFDMDRAKDTTIYVDDSGVEYQRNTPISTTGLYDSVEDVWRVVDGAKEYPESAVKIWG